MNVISEVGSAGQVIVLRLGPGVDLIEGIELACQKHQIKHGIITACFGSLKQMRLRYYYPPTDPNDPFSKDRDLELKQSFSFLSGQGMVCEMDNGEIDVHIHGCLRGEDGKVYGSDIPRGGNIVKNTMDVCVLEVSNLKLLRTWDEQTQHLQLKPVKEA